MTDVKDKKDLMLFTATDDEMVFEFKLYGDDFTLAGTRYYCHYFTYYPVIEEGAEGVLFLESEDGDELVLVPRNSAAIYTSGDTSTVGQFVLIESVSDHTYIEFFDYEAGTYQYFEYDTANTSFTALGEVSGVYDWYNQGSSEADDTYQLILFDGKEQTAIYRWRVEDRQTYVGYYGSYTYDENTYRGVFTVDPDFELDPSDDSLKFSLGTDGTGYPVFFTQYKQFKGEEDVTFAGETPLKLDAYGFAEYDGMEGNYSFANVGDLGDGIYRIYAAFYINGEPKDAEIFDINFKTKTYTICGYECDFYYEDIAREELLEFDGYGHVTYYNIDNETAEGAYTVIGYDEEGRIIINVTFEGEDPYLIRCYYLLDDEGDFIGHYTKEVEIKGTYVSDKWEYLTIDTFGEAIYTDEYGVSYEGEITQFTEHVVSFQGEYAQNAIYCKLEGSAFTVPEDGMLIDGDTLVKYLGGDETAIKIPDEVTKIAPLAFSEHVYGSNYSGAPIVSLDLNNVAEIGDNAFNGCSVLKSVTGKQLKKVGKNAFYACIELTTLDLPALEEIGEMAFHLCESLTKVTLDKVKIVYAAAFSNCYELTEISLPAAEELYEGVFFDCFALKLVTLGEHLTQIGTPDEQVAGVFEREGGFEQARLKVTLLCAEAPVVGKQLFAGVASYTVVVNDIATVKKFYLADGWADYNNCVGCQGDEEYVGTYYNYRDGSVYAFVLDETLHEVTPYAINHKGAYEVRDDGIYSITFSQWAEGKYTETKLVTFGENGSLVYDPYEYGPEYSYTYFKAGKEFTLHVGDSDAIVFTPGEFTSLATGDVYEVSAKWTTGGTQKDAKVKASYQADGGFTLYLKAGENRYAINSLSTAGGKVTASLGREEFDPVIKRYTMSDESLLVVSQNNKAETDYTVSFVLAAIRDENNVPFSLANFAVEKNADGTFTAKESYVFAGYSYKLTFAVNDDGTFSYTYTCDREIVVNSADGSAKVVAYQSATGEITSVTLFVGGSEVGEDIKNFVLTHEENSKVYRWLVYDYNYAGSFTFTFMGEGETLTGNLSVGTVVKGYLDGVYAIAFYEGTTRTDFYMGRSNGEYSKVAASDITEGDGYLTVKFQEETFYVTFDLESRTALVVFADVTYQSDEYSDLEGSVRVERNPDGTAKSMTLTMGDKSYTTFTEYDYYYIFTNGTDYYYVTLSSNSCRISALSAKAFTSGEFTITLLVQSNNEVVGVASATYQNKAVVVTFESDYISGKDCALLSFTVGDVTKNYLANITDSTMAELEEHILTTSDGKYRVTVLTSGNDFVYGVTKFEEKDGDGFKELTITWSSATEGDGYNFQFGTDTGSYDFNIVKVGNDWTATLVNEYHW